MKLVLLIIIKLYWLLIPKKARRKCLFKTSCSHYVYNKTIRGGLLIGLKALEFRFRNCKPPYDIINIGDEKLLISATHEIFKREELNDYLFQKNITK